MLKLNKKSHNQSGLVSILVTLLVILIISLIVIGFARLVRRDQTQSLDRQLNTQALYAAETAINDTLQFLTDPANPDNLKKEGTTCDREATDFISVANLDNVLEEDADVSYTCLLVDPTPPTLTYQNVSPDKSSKVIVLNTNDPNTAGDEDPMTELELSWESPGLDGENCNSTHYNDIAGRFKSFTNWNTTCTNPVIRIDLIAENRTDSRSNMLSNTATFFAFPSSQGTTDVAFSSGVGNNQGEVKEARCDTTFTRNCQIKITGLTQNTYYLRVTPIYKSATFDIAAKNGGTTLEFLNEQALIDATGKARDILKRVQVRASLSDNNSQPNFTLQSGVTLCKRILVDPVTPRARKNPGDPSTCDLD